MEAELIVNLRRAQILISHQKSFLVHHYGGLLILAPESSGFLPLQTGETAPPACPLSRAAPTSARAEGKKARPHTLYLAKDWDWRLNRCLSMTARSQNEVASEHRPKQTVSALTPTAAELQSRVGGLVDRRVEWWVLDCWLNDIGQITSHCEAKR